MELNEKTEWPESAPVELGNPIRIEEFLSSEIQKRNITLVGELDLREPTSYAGTGWSLFDLANYLANKNIIKNSLTVEKMKDWKYPATLAIWSVGRAQLAEDGNKHWDLDGYSPNQRSGLATMFSNSIEKLKLETFEGELLGAQRHVQLARIHAMIPDFAAKRYSDLIHKAVKYHRPKIQILQDVIEDTIISKGVKRLFTAKQDIGLDLIERSFNYLAYGYELDLPDRLKSKLNRNGVIKQTRKKGDDFPKVHFAEYAGALEILGGFSWSIVDETGQHIDHDRVPESNIFASKSDSEKILILDKSPGYLLFDARGNLIYGTSLPVEGGFLLWRNDVEIKSEIIQMEYGYLPEWHDWNYTYFQDLTDLILQLPDKTQKVFTAKKYVSLVDFRVPNLIDIDRQGVYSAYPEVKEPQYLKLTDHLTDTQLELNNHVGPILDEPGGEIDITVSSGLGKSRSWKGLVIPGIEVGGLSNSQRLGTKCKVELKLPASWKFVIPPEFEGESRAELIIDVHANQEPVLLKVRDSAAEEYFLGLQVPVLSWTIEFEKKESVTLGNTLRININERKSIRALILHGVNEYVPVLMASGQPVLGRKRGDSARYDLRILADMENETENSVSMLWNYESIQLISFVKLESKKMKSVDPKNFAFDAIEKGLFSQGDWDSYKAETQQQSMDLRKSLRRQRGNW